MKNNEFDIVITGGGLIGATLALAITLSNPQLSIAIIEAVEPSADNQPSFDSRAIAIAQGSKHLLDSYGLWSGMKHHAEPIAKIQVSDRGHIGKSYLNAKQFNMSALGFVLEVRHLGHALMNQLKLHSNVQWFCPAKLSAMQESAEQLTLTLNDEQTLQTKLLLVADGGQSLTRQLVNIGNTVDDYGQTAIITNVSMDEPHQQQAYERFTESGPIALLPLTDNRFSLVWCVPPEQVDTMLAWDDDKFLNELQQAFGYRAGSLIKVGKRFSYPLALTLADDIVGHRVALVGNSSHTLHPIAGQGFNLGMRDIDALTHIIKQSQDEGEDIGSFQSLRCYQQMRREDLDKVVTMTDSLVRLFSNSGKLLALGRTMGLLSMQMLDCLKQPIAFQGMGFNANRNKQHNKDLNKGQ
jgi:2-octaprenyl-6-methoxyphenol hydroxylase